MFINFIFDRLMYCNQKNKIKTVSSLCSQANSNTNTEI